MYIAHVADLCDKGFTRSDNGSGHETRDETMTTAIENAPAAEIWMNVKAVRNSCAAILAGSSDQPALEAIIAKIDRMMKRADTDAARQMFLEDSDLWPC